MIASPKTSAIELKAVTKTYQDGTLEVPVLRGVSFTVQRGESVAIMGPSGSGKSTIMNLIGLLDRPTGGRIWLQGEPVHLSMSDKRLADLRAAKIGFIFQSFNLLPRLNALANVLLPTQYLRRPGARARAVALLERLGLGERLTHLPNQLSGGEKQRVAIARALMNEPEIILADEPTGNLDSKSGKEVLDTLLELCGEGKTVLIVTHDPNVAKRCKRVIRILDGAVEPHGK